MLDLVGEEGEDLGVVGGGEEGSLGLGGCYCGG